SWMGVSDRTWFYSGIAVVVIHQVLGTLVFRLQLVLSLFTKMFGKYDLTVWGLIFLPLLALRPLITIAIGIADYGSLGGSQTILIILGVILCIPAIYTLHSVMKYFGLPRALGGDHFYQEYRDMPMVTKGAFRYSSNAMYSYVPLLLWSIALISG
ncbi:MAG: hypothetical protein GWN61_22415, partial [candidate division Zixibacteria bacterium]|nr:hypothetical protein [candidate division Zixibacteria bacterium]NIW49375.1 hypothetical protein [Gammaproteobacteria bacterium]NIR67236.1 hypothetical protein [candidate division Zixibacteria bacterium]NIS48618.1 hypothetical protein [candidate division Zixibacteria bacterium]NIU16685.1 hypothetical protein [candidate division Zixibacteria bacterium]